MHKINGSNHTHTLIQANMEADTQLNHSHEIQ